MERLHCDVRPDWERKVESVGLTFHHTHLPNGEAAVCWDESAYYRFSAREIMPLLLVIGQYMALARIMATVRIDLEPAIGAEALGVAGEAPKTRAPSPG